MDKRAINGALKDRMFLVVYLMICLLVILCQTIQAIIFKNQKPIVVLNDILIYLQNNNILKNLNDIREFLMSPFGIMRLFISQHTIEHYTIL